VILTSVGLKDVRNYASLEFLPAPGLNVILGDNAQGKSNLLEAIAMLGTGKSFRTARESELIREGCSQAILAGEACVIAGTVRLTCAMRATARGARKEYLVNGEPVRYAAFLGRARVVTFAPGDLQLVEGSPALRRSFLNAALAQGSVNYYAALFEYGRALAQKNAILRGQIAQDEALLATYDERLVESGVALISERSRYVDEIAVVARDAATNWFDAQADGALEITYRTNIPFATPARKEIRDAFVQHLAMRKDSERARGQALVGPHRDDVHFSLGGRSLASFGSQGQRRTAVLALKVAEYAVMRNRCGEAPLLLLDDVLSELDAKRQEAFLESLGTIEQAFITSAGARPSAPTAAAYRIDSAILTQVF